MFEHFVEAQAPVYSRVLQELRGGRKQSHWMWFIFPQLAVLGRSDMAKRFGLTSLAEARLYLEHPVLGPRLLECSELAGRIETGTAREVFGTPDDLKFRSSMTLFGIAAPEHPVFAAALLRFHAGTRDELTLQVLAKA